ncbi:MAG: 50S ribosomal protein L10 [Bacteroidales bacterium]|nr:50S ribosomal protein L10 [Bacteroidales bacterium]MDD4208905.1 50S ribosomal protein L10 [Bacteroidales bacterium]
MRKEEKTKIIDEIAALLSSYDNVYVADLTGLTVEKSNNLRRLCFRKGVKLKMVKNTLLKKAMEQLDTDYSEMYPALHGNSAIMLSEIGNVPARIIKDFRIKSPIPALKVAFIDKSIYLGDCQLDALYHLKTKEELVGDIIGLLQSPARNVISALQSGGGKLAGIVKTLSEK